MKSVHELKSWPEFFSEIIAGRKTHELRNNDRDYQVGDILLLKEFDRFEDKYTGRELRAEVTYITNVSNPCAESRRALKSNYCILSIHLVASELGGASHQLVTAIASRT